MLTKISLFVFFASANASGVHICHATGLFMCPRTYSIPRSLCQHIYSR